MSEQWKNGAYILNADDFVGVEFSSEEATPTEQLNRQEHTMWQEIHECERKLNIPQGDCLVEMNAMGLAQYQPKKGVTPEQIEKAHTYLRDFVSQRSPDRIPLSVIERLCSVYPEQTVFSMMSQNEKEVFIDCVEISLDYSEPVSKTEYRLYQMATKERETHAKQKPTAKRESRDMLR